MSGTRRTLPCLACGYVGLEGKDVKATLVEYPAGERRTVTVAINSAEDQRGVRGLEYQEVPERYGAEYRCMDEAACRERVMAQTPSAPPPEPVVAEPRWEL